MSYSANLNERFLQMLFFVVPSLDRKRKHKFDNYKLSTSIRDETGKRGYPEWNSRTHENKLGTFCDTIETTIIM